MIALTPNQTFSRWTILKIFPANIIKYETCLVRCTCGTTKIVRSNNLKYGLSKSCGCLKRESLSQRNRLRCTKHGHARAGKASPEYRSWFRMKDRCTNKHDPKYNRYGGRGIKICHRWNSFENFLKDMGLKPARNYTIERIDNDSNYTPQNCRWATPKEQSINKRNTILLTAFNRTQCLTHWCRELKKSPTFLKRHLTRGLSLEQIIMNSM